MIPVEYVSEPQHSVLALSLLKRNKFKDIVSCYVFGENISFNQN